MVRALLDRLEPQIRKAFQEAFERHAARIDARALIAALEAQDIERAIRVLRIDTSLLFPLDEAIRNAFITGGTTAVTELPRGIAGLFAFNGRHPRAERWIRENVGDKIQGIVEEQIETTRAVVLNGLQEQRGATAVAREITGRMVGRKRFGGYLGLTSEQADSIMRGRAKLASGDPALMREYLRLKLRNKRHDGKIKAAVKAGRPIRGRELDRIMEDHRSKALGYRGRVIARNEAHVALAAGRNEFYEQSLDNPEVETVKVRWQHNLSQEPREDHRAMDGKVIDLGEAFDFPDAEMRHPHDPAGGAKHSINCRCVAVYRVKMRRD